MKFLAMQLKKRADMPSNKLCPLLHIVGTDQGDTTPLSKNAIFTISLSTLRWSTLLKNRFLSFSTESSANALQQSMPTLNISFVGLESLPQLISLKKVCGTYWNVWLCFRCQVLNTSNGNFFTRVASIAFC